MYGSLLEYIQNNIKYLEEVIEGKHPILVDGQHEMHCIVAGVEGDEEAGCSIECPLYIHTGNSFCKLSHNALNNLNEAEQLLLAIEVAELLKEFTRHVQQFR